jgi:dihydrofolate synthase / folylpolyglutamate synthase
MRFQRLQDWLDWQETLHPQSIDLRLERVAAVADALNLLEGGVTTVTVAGTNGKGTVATIVSSLLQQMGFRVGLYTSPHLLRYNERIRVDGCPASDEAICRAFAAADAVRGDRSLTYFEFGTLAAVWLFREAKVDFRVLEVGLGGRLDAVNVWDPDVAVVTGVDLDHERWLGSDRESIGREKAGILRSGRPAVLGEQNPPQSVLDAARALDARVFRQGVDFELAVTPQGVHWRWEAAAATLQLPPGVAAGLEGARERNAGTALAVVHALGLQRRLTPLGLAAGLGAAPPGRLQRIPGNPEWLLDVAHNPQSARELARWLGAHPVQGPTVAIVAVMADKQREPMFRALSGQVEVWVATDVPSSRALAASVLAGELRAWCQGEVSVAEDPEAAMALARSQAGPDGRVVVFGSFLTVQAAMERLPPVEIHGPVPGPGRG